MLEKYDAATREVYTISSSHITYVTILLNCVSTKWQYDSYLLDLRAQGEERVTVPHLTKVLVCLHTLFVFLFPWN